VGRFRLEGSSCGRILRCELLVNHRFIGPSNLLRNIFNRSGLRPARRRDEAIGEFASGVIPPGVRLKLPVLVGGVALIVGCHGQAYREVYQQKMIREIRTLEDRLNEAEYRNRVLMQQLARRGEEIFMTPIGQAVPMGSSPVRVDGQRGGPGSSRSVTPERLPKPLEKGVDGAPASGDATRSVPPKLPARPLQDLPGTPNVPIDPTLPELIPPAVPIPPGKESIEFPDVDLGDPVPPAGLNAPMEAPPGQIPIPAPPKAPEVPAAEEPQRDPVGIRIDPSMSGGHREDGPEGATGMQLLVQPIDASGVPIPIERFDIAADLEVVLTDPGSDPVGEELGRWVYAAEELHGLMRPGSGGGLQLYLTWKGKRPSGDRVTARVKLLDATQELELSAEAELLTVEPSAADWNPRAARIPNAKPSEGIMPPSVRR
jgi:hypothetical protein